MMLDEVSRLATVMAILENGRGERYTLRFTEEADRKDTIESGSWFYGKTIFALAEYDVRSNAAAVPNVSVLMWVEVFGLPLDLLTKKTLYMVGSKLGRIITHDNPRLLNGSRARVCIDHQISDPVNFGFILSKPGMTAAALTASLQRLPNQTSVTAPQAQALVSQAKSLMPTLTRKKRSATSLMLEDYGKHQKGTAAVGAAEHPTLGPILVLSLPHLAGSPIVSPLKKRKVGRPLGSLNKKKEEVINP
ncbi:hypothetical protein ACLB2K_012781 [Fragaria x ananassa]